LNRNYDVRQVRTLYATLQQAVRQDQRVGLAFIGNRRRTAERMANTDELIARMKGDLDAREGKLTLTQPEYVRVMATLRRDNGILSFYHDMFQLAKANLEYAREHRPNDPAAHYYYGKVLKLIGRTEEDRKLADEAFQRALQFDHRERNYGAHFYRALALIDRKDASLNSEIAKELQAYLMASIRFASEEASFANALPANIDDMYDYLTEVGDVKWRPIVPDPQAGVDSGRHRRPATGIAAEGGEARTAATEEAVTHAVLYPLAHSLAHVFAPGRCRRSRPPPPEGRPVMCKRGHHVT
jgi:tetratricopeptide (TPR) repeat protein